MLRKPVSVPNAGGCARCQARPCAIGGSLPGPVRFSPPVALPAPMRAFQSLPGPVRRLPLLLLRFPYLECTLILNPGFWEGCLHCRHDDMQLSWPRVLVVKNGFKIKLHDASCVKMKHLIIVHELLEAGSHAAWSAVEDLSTMSSSPRWAIT